MVESREVDQGQRWQFRPRDLDTQDVVREIVVVVTDSHGLLGLLNRVAEIVVGPRCLIEQPHAGTVVQLRSATRICSYDADLETCLLCFS